MDVYNKDSCKRIIICKYNVCFNDSLISYGNVCDDGAGRDVTPGPRPRARSPSYHMFTVIGYFLDFSTD